MNCTSLMYYTMAHFQLATPFMPLQDYNVTEVIGNGLIG